MAVYVDDNASRLLYGQPTLSNDAHLKIQPHDSVDHHQLVFVLHYHHFRFKTTYRYGLLSISMRW